MAEVDTPITQLAAGHETEENVTEDEQNQPQEQDTETVDPADPPMSKRKRKKMEQQQRKQHYLKDKRQKERLRKKERLKEARAQGKDVGPSRKALKHNTMEKSLCKVKVAIDCSFDELMTEKDIKSIVKQINFCYASNRRATDPVQFHITDFTGRLKSTMDSIGDYPKWDINVHSQSFLDMFGRDDVMYLSSDSKNVLKTLEDSKVYVIGGLVDHNHHKGLCLQLAEEKGLTHAQLPIGDYVALESRNTLAVNHVFEILLRYTESRDWKDAFYKVIPKRKVTQPNNDVLVEEEADEHQVFSTQTTAEPQPEDKQDCSENINSKTADIDHCGTSDSLEVNSSSEKTTILDS